MSTHYQVVSFTVWYIYPLDDNFWPVVCPLLIFVYFWDCCIVVLSHRVIILCLCVFVYFFFVVAYVTGALLYLLCVPFFTFFLPLRSSLGLFVVASLWWVVEFESLTCANKLSYEVKDEQRICHNPSGSWCSSIIMWPWDKHQRHFQTNVSLKIQSLYYLFSLILLLLLELTSVCHCFNHTETSAAAVAYSQLTSAPLL